MAADSSAMWSCQPSWLITPAEMAGGPRLGAQIIPLGTPGTDAQTTMSRALNGGSMRVVIEQD
jgi:hypothetical protein